MESIWYCRYNHMAEEVNAIISLNFAVETRRLDLFE